MELLGFGSFVSVDTSVDQENEIEDEDDIDISNGDEDFMESVSSPSHSGGITSPEVDRFQDFETESDDSSEVTNELQIVDEDPYQFIASPVVSRGIENKKRRGKTEEK